MRDQGCLWDELTCASAAQGGHLELLQWARAKGCLWDEWTCAGAEGNGHLAVLQWAQNQGCPWVKKDTTRLCREFVRANPLHFAKTSRYSSKREPKDANVTSGHAR